MSLISGETTFSHNSDQNPDHNSHSFQTGTKLRPSNTDQHTTYPNLTESTAGNVVYLHKLEFEFCSILLRKIIVSYNVLLNTVKDSICLWLVTSGPQFISYVNHKNTNSKLLSQFLTNFCFG